MVEFQLCGGKHLYAMWTKVLSTDTLQLHGKPWHEAPSFMLMLMPEDVWSSAANMRLDTLQPNCNVMFSNTSGLSCCGSLTLQFCSVTIFLEHLVGKKFHKLNCCSNSASSLGWPFLSQMFRKAGCMARCFILNTCPYVVLLLLLLVNL